MYLSGYVVLFCVLVRTQHHLSLGGLCFFVFWMCVFMFVLCEALLSNICVWIWKPNEDKLSVIQYLWESQVEIVIDGG